MNQQDVTFEMNNVADTLEAMASFIRSVFVVSDKPTSQMETMAQEWRKKIGPSQSPKKLIAEPRNKGILNFVRGELQKQGLNRDTIKVGGTYEIPSSPDFDDKRVQIATCNTLLGMFGKGNYRTIRSEGQVLFTVDKKGE